VLLSARQHANEATSTQAAFDWLERLLADGDLLRRANLVVHPLENPDGARLHAAVRSLAPHHMHHAARGTAFGADLQLDPRVHGEVIPESLLRRDAARAWRPVLHLNDHGYPAHGWVRAQTGHLPRGYEDWSLPVGQTTILITHDGGEAEAAALRDALAAAVARALGTDPEIAAGTRAQFRRSARYRPPEATPFTLRAGLPFWLSHRPRPRARRTTTAPWRRGSPSSPRWPTRRSTARRGTPASAATRSPTRPCCAASSTRGAFPTTPAAEPPIPLGEGHRRLLSGIRQSGRVP
jgi:hypothetical protein